MCSKIGPSCHICITYIQISYDNEYTLLQKTKTRTLLSLALLKKRHCLVRYTKMLALVYHDASISIIELYKFKDVGTYFKYHCIHISIGILNVEERHVISYIVYVIYFPFPPYDLLHPPKDIIHTHTSLRRPIVSIKTLKRPKPLKYKNPKPSLSLKTTITFERVLYSHPNLQLFFCQE